MDDPQGDPAEVALLRMELFDMRPRVFTTADQRIALALAHHPAARC